MFSVAYCWSEPQKIVFQVENITNYAQLPVEYRSSELLYFFRERVFPTSHDNRNEHFEFDN